MHPQTLQTWSRGDGHWLPEPTTCFEIMGEKVRFHKIGLIMMPKRIGYKIYTMFLIYTCKRQDEKLVHYNLSQEMHFDNLFLELVACDIPYRLGHKYRR